MENNNESIKFNCSSCGLCCKMIGKQVTLARKIVYDNRVSTTINDMTREIANFPHEFDANGVCSKLNKEDNTCSVYEDRPDICNVETTYNNYYAGKVSKDKFFNDNENICKQLIEREKK